MPILAPEPGVWPEVLLDQSEGLPKGWSWSALHVRSRTEKAVARSLREKGVSYFLPMYEDWRTYQRRRVCSQTPLFSGYLFAAGPDEGIAGRVQTKHVVNCLPIDDQPRFDREIRRIYQLIRSGLPVSPEGRLQPGMPARIVSGPLAGYEGRVIRNEKSLRFIIEVNFLQKGASVQIDGSMIEAM